MGRDVCDAFSGWIIEGWGRDVYDTLSGWIIEGWGGMFVIHFVG